MQLNQKVSTPYGVGRVVKVRPNDYVVEPVTWKLAAGQKPLFYMNPKDVQPLFKVSDKVQTSFGKGQIVDFHKDRNIYVVTLSNWSLANGKSPTLFLNDEAMTLVAHSADELARIAAEQAIEQFLKRAAALKEEAKALYTAKDFEKAKAKYTEVMECLQGAGNDIQGDQRARFLDHCVTCHSNLALCSWNLNNYVECVAFANNSLSLLDALEGKVPASDLWKSMLTLGYSEEKLSEMKLKAYRIKGKAELKRGRLEEAKQNLELALKLSKNDKVTKELDDLLMDVVRLQSSEKKKEKALWKKAFKKRDAEAEEELPSPAKPPLSPKKSVEKKPISSEVSKPTSSSLFSWGLPTWVAFSLFASAAAAAAFVGYKHYIQRRR